MPRYTRESKKNERNAMLDVYQNFTFFPITQPRPTTHNGKWEITAIPAYDLQRPERAKEVKRVKRKTLNYQQNKLEN